jgi:hypothetical protein
MFGRAQAIAQAMMPDAAGVRCSRSYATSWRWVISSGSWGEAGLHWWARRGVAVRAPTPLLTAELASGRCADAVRPWTGAGRSACPFL